MADPEGPWGLDLPFFTCVILSCPICISEVAFLFSVLERDVSSI